MATYAVYIKDLPNGCVEVHRQLESGIHGAPSVAANLALALSEAVKAIAERDGDIIQRLPQTSITAALVKGASA